MAGPGSHPDLLPAARSPQNRLPVTSARWNPEEGPRAHASETKEDPAAQPPVPVTRYAHEYYLLCTGLCQGVSYPIVPALPLQPRKFLVDSRRILADYWDREDAPTL